MTTTITDDDLDPVRRGARWTTREIAQQPGLWRMIAGRSSEQTESFLAPLLERADLRIVLTGAGTSAFAGQVLAADLRRRLHRRVDAVATTDIVANPGDCFAEDLPTLLVSFARSGDSPESVASTELAEQCLTEVHHLLVTCNPHGELVRRHQGEDRSHVMLMPAEADDQGFAMTSSFTSMTLAALVALDPSRGHDLGGRLATIAEDALGDWDARALEISQRGYQRIVYLGSGALKGLARESALKVLELTAGELVAMGDSPLAFRHGPKAVLDDRTLVVVYLSNDPYTRAYDLDLLTELRQAQGAAHVIAVSAEHHDLPADQATWVLRDASDLDDVALALLFVLCAQLIALHSSMTLGRLADNPFPSGDVNRVVQGVRLYPLDRRT